jgi:hypothetical protein
MTEVQVIILICIYAAVALLTGAFVTALRSRGQFSTFNSGDFEVVQILGSVLWPVTWIILIGWPISLLISAKYARMIDKLEQQKRDHT